jgi:hypothetical protein
MNSSWNLELRLCGSATSGAHGANVGANHHSNSAMAATSLAYPPWRCTRSRGTSSCVQGRAPAGPALSKSAPGQLARVTAGQLVRAPPALMVMDVASSTVNMVHCDDLAQAPRSRTLVGSGRAQPCPRTTTGIWNRAVDDLTTNRARARARAATPPNVTLVTVRRSNQSSGSVEPRLA